jgi:N-acetylmuramoyl-L-alanine amidase
MFPVRFLCVCVSILYLAGSAPSRASTANPPPAADAAAAVAIAADITNDERKTQLRVTLSRPVTARAFLMERPDRVIIDLPDVNFQLPPETGRKRSGLISSFRYGVFAPGRSRMVLDLAQPAVVAQLDVASDADGAAQLVLELVRADRQGFRTAVEAAEPEPETTGSVAVRPQSRADQRPVIAIDPGHGGVDPGAIATTGAYEKDVVFGFADRLRRRLEASGRYRVVLTRDGDIFVPLDERVRLARAAKADLFISIHADSISAAPHVRGLTVYTGSEQASDKESQRLAERENTADAAGGLHRDDSRGEVADILQDLILRETRSLSKKPQRQAAFRVLRAPDIPSVLVELGYLSSKKDIDLLLSDSWRDRSTAAIAVAIDRFFATRLAVQGPAPVSP